jgi:ketosteroid isomerase-like protein/predicted ester cyclase/quercetin dioxygenase-like cupin family protein
MLVSLLVLVLGAAAPASGRGDEQNEQIVRKMIDAINARDFDALDEVIAADLRRHCAATPDVDVRSLADFKAFLRRDFAALPDARMETDIMMTEGDKVALRAAYRGTQTGQMGPFPPSNRTVEIPFLSILRIENGKIAEMWVEWDNVAVLTQLGHMRSMPSDAVVGQQDHGPTRENHRQALIDTREAWGRVIAAGDVERIFSFWTDDVVIYPVDGPPVTGKAAVREYVRRNRQELGVVPRMHLLEVAVSASGDLGYTVGTHEWMDREGRATRPGQYVTLWRRNEAGEWKCFLEIHSPRPAEDGLESEAEAQDRDVRKPFYLHDSDLEWKRHEINDGWVEIAFLYTDLDTQAQKLLIRHSLGAHVPKHWHSANETHVCVSGSLTLEDEMGGRATLRPGEFAYTPAEVVHEAWASQEETTVMLVMVDGPFDVNWVEPPRQAAKQEQP